MAELITVPTLHIEQGKIGDTDYDTPIRVEFYNGSFCLVQEGDFDYPETITISPKHWKNIVKEINKALPEAKAWLERKSL